MADPGMTQKFLEEALNIKVDKFLVNKGSNLGDGYMCVLFGVDVWTGGNIEPLSLLIKCLPRNPVRQQMLRESGMFTAELRMYDTVIPIIKELISQNSAVGLRLSFPTFYGGREIIASCEQLENYLIMADLRKSGNFRLGDRSNGLDYEHMSLVMEALALLHALSWVLKKRENKNLTQLYSFLSGIGLEKVFRDFGSSTEDTVAQEIGLFVDEPRIVDALQYIGPLANSVIALYYPSSNLDTNLTKDSVLKTPGAVVPNEEPWNVLVHGDCWENNMLFRYDAATKRPVEVVFIDYQTCHEGDPMTDVCNALLCGTKHLIRKHNQSFLRMYFDKFTDVCEKFNVQTLPGWSWDELVRRNHRGQAFGISMSVISLPLELQDEEDVKDLDETDVGQETEGCPPEDATKKFIEQMMTVKMDSSLLKDRLRDIIEDGINAGIV